MRAAQIWDLLQRYSSYNVRPNNPVATFDLLSGSGLRTTLPTILFTRSVTRQVFFSAHLHSSHYNTKHHRLFTVSLIAAVGQHHFIGISFLFKFSVVLPSLRLSGITAHRTAETIFLFEFWGEVSTPAFVSKLASRVLIEAPRPLICVFLFIFYLMY